MLIVNTTKLFLLLAKQLLIFQTA